MKRLIQFVCVMLCTPILFLSTSSCSRTQTAKSTIPKFYDEAAIAETNALIAEGYKALEGDRFDEALSAFAKAGERVPCGFTREYHTAAAYFQIGDNEAGFQWMARLVDNDWDIPEYFNYYPNVDSLKLDPRFAQLVARSKENYQRNTAALAQGFPECEPPPVIFATTDDLTAWITEQDRIYNLNRPFWTGTEHLMAKIDLRMRILEAQKALAANDPTFDYELERVRLAFGLKPGDRPEWDAVSDLVCHEADQYLQSSPAEMAGQEACYLAGAALSRKFADDDSRRIEAFREAGDYLRKVSEESEYFGAAQALMIANNFILPNADGETLKVQLASIVERFPTDRHVSREISTRLGKGAAGYVWPIPLGLPDIDGKPVTLDDYRGRLLLIDFWAIWCPPCRKALPVFREVYEKYHAQGLEILSISLDEPEKTTLDDFRAWIEENGLNWRHIYDGLAWDSELVKRYFVARVPTAFLVGRDGSLVAWGDALHRDNLAATIEKVISRAGQ